jgi:hypothetical protein
MLATIHLVNWLEYRHQSDGQQGYDHSWGATILTIFGAISEQGNALLALSAAVAGAIFLASVQQGCPNP